MSSTSLLKCSQSIAPSFAREEAVQAAGPAVNDLAIRHIASDVSPASEIGILNADLETILNFNLETVNPEHDVPTARKVSDDEVFAAAYKVMQRLGPGDLTLGQIADEAGVTAGLLVQRFGSKRDLLLKLSEQFSGGTGEMFAAAPARPSIAAGDDSRLCRLHGRHG